MIDLASRVASHDPWNEWSFEPSILIPLLITVLIYLWGVHNIWKRAGTGHGIAARQWLSFAGAILVLILTLLSPLHALSDELFSAHMVQHLLLMLVAAPLLVLSDIQLAFLWALPRHSAQEIGSGFKQSGPAVSVWRAFNNPVIVWILFTATMWLWHAPLFYQAALRNEIIHALEHFTFLFTAILFWWILLKRNRADHLHYAITVPFLFLTVLQSGILGALMTFTSQPWYPDYAASVTNWGLTPLQDQQLAGLIMWMPGGAVFTLLTIGYFAAWLHALEERDPRFQQRKVHPTRHEIPE